MNKDKKIIILGAGPAGLSAAWKLSLANMDVEVLELESQVGGQCRTIKHKEYLFDLGGHRFITQNTELAKEIYSLMNNEIIDRPRKSSIRLKGKYFNYPLDGKDLLKNLDLSLSIKCFADYLWTTLKNKFIPKPDKSFEDWVVNRFGRSLYNLYFGPYSEKLWGIAPTEISADWAAQRISLLNLWDVFLRLLGKKKKMPKTYATKFYYPEKGIGRIPERMAEVIIEKGCKIHLNSKVKAVKSNGNKIISVKYVTNGVEKTISGDFIISTIPLPDFIKGLEPKLSTSCLEAVNSLNFRALKFLNITLDKNIISDNTWIYIPEEQYIFMRIQEPKNWSPYNSPEGKTSIILEIACNVGDRIWNASDKEIYERCIEDLKQVGFNDIREKTIDYFTTTLEHAYPIYKLNYKQLLKTIFAEINSFENLICCGREGLFRYNNMDHSIEMGLLTAEHILFGLPKNEIYKIANEEGLFEHEEKQAKIVGIE